MNTGSFLGIVPQKKPHKTHCTEKHMCEQGDVTLLLLPIPSFTVCGI